MRQCGVPALDSFTFAALDLWSSASRRRDANHVGNVLFASRLAVCGKTWKLKFFSLLKVIASGVFDRSRRFLVV